MKIDILQTKLYENLQVHNKTILAVHRTVSYAREGEDYDFANRKISIWFNPLKCKQLALSRIYPAIAPEQNREEYCLYLYASNYLCLFLINAFYADQKNIAFTDIGGGIGWLIYYLSKLGYTNFNNIDNFSQLPQCVFEQLMEQAQINCLVNNTEFKATVLNNVAIVKWYLTCSIITPETELICLNTNPSLEVAAEEMLWEKNFRFLCRDKDNFAIAYCREDKYEDFKNILKPYSICTYQGE